MFVHLKLIIIHLLYFYIKQSLAAKQFIYNEDLVICVNFGG